MAEKYYTDENGVTFNESGELVADITPQVNNIEIDLDTAKMEDLALNSPAKYMTTYNKPKEWVLDEKEARLAQIQRSAWTPEKASRLGSLKYGFKQFLIDTYDTPRELGSALALGAANIEDGFYPNADKTAVQRWYDNFGRLDVESDQIVNEYMSSHAGQHPYWLMGGSVALGLARDMAVAGGFAKLGASAATKAATKKATERFVGEEVAARYTGMAAAQGAKKVGEKAITTSVFAQEFGSGTLNDISQYIEKTGDKDLKYYDPSVDLAVNLGVSLLSAQIEKGLGVERYVPRLVAQAVRRGEKIPALAQVIMRGVEGGLGEMSEETLQEGLSQFGDMIKGYREWWDWDSDQIVTSAILGGIGGTGASAGLHYVNRRIAINRLKAEGLDENVAADLVDTVISNETNKTLNNLSAVNELKTQNGQAYEKLKSAMKRALETQGWKDKVIKDGVPMDIDEYVSLNAKDFIKPAIYYSNKYNIPIDLFLDVAEFTGFNNVLVLRDLGTPEQIKAKIDAQSNIIKTQQDLKKTGAGNNQLLNEAKVKKAILQKAYINATLSKEIEKVNLEESKTPEIKQEIETANEDADTLTKTESVEDFNTQMNNKTKNNVPLTTGQKNKRFGNAVIKRIFGKDKFGFDSVMTLPEYANAKQGIVNSAMRIFDFVKKHRTYGLYTDLRNALNQMRTVNQSNFIESITTPSLDGKDVIAQNAFLYHFLFSDSNTITAFIDAYLQRAEASLNNETKTDLSKKDIVGQSFESIDKLMQVQAESAGIEYTSIYNEDGSLADKNVAAVFVSYENQFLVESSKTTILEQKDIVSVDMAIEDNANRVRNLKYGESFIYEQNGNRFMADNYGGGINIKLLDKNNKEISSISIKPLNNNVADIRVIDEINIGKHKASTILYEAERIFGDLQAHPENNKKAQDFWKNVGFTEKNNETDLMQRPTYQEDTIMVDGVKRSALNHDEGLIARTEKGLINFWKWFGDSKVVDEQGRPLVVYHGSDVSGIEVFDNQANQTKQRQIGAEKGYFFTDSKKVAERFRTTEQRKAESKYYAENTIREPVTEEKYDAQGRYLGSVHYTKTTLPESKNFGLYPVYLKAESVNEYSGEDIGVGEERATALESAKQSGKDGVIIYKADTGAGIANEYIVFEPNQIKSVDNRGTFSEKTGNIYYQSRAANGFYDPELSAIVLGKNFNTMTLPHEMAHYWLDALFKVYKRMQAGQITANTGFMQEIEEMFDTFGINKNQENLTKGQHEKFARMTEAYLTGIGISPDANQTYKAYLKWIPEKYKSLQQLAYLDDQGRMKLPFLDQKAVDFFNRWYENPTLPSLSTSPERQRYMNVDKSNGELINVSIKEMNDREKEFAQDAEEQIRTDERLYNTLEENIPNGIKSTADAQKVVINDRSNFLKESQAEQNNIKEEPERRWYERKSRETESQLAKEYIQKNPEHAKEVVYGDPEFILNDTGVDRATLINVYMALNNITPQHPDWATLHTNIAINQSLAGTQLALSNDKSYGAYLDALREVENALELKAATNYAGSKRGAREKFNTDIQRFLDRELPSIFATQPNSKEREQALRMMFEKARTTFSGNTTRTFLNQVDLDYAKSQKTKTEAFMRWAINQIKKDAGAKLNNQQQAQLLEISAKAQQALIDLDNPDSAKAVAAALEILKWQVEKNKMMGISPKKFSLFGDYAPRAMLASFNTLLITNPPSTFMNTWIVRALRADIFGKNRVSSKSIEDEIKRIKAIYNATGMNLAQMEKPTSPSLLHGEKYSASGQKWYDPYTILGREDNFFRVPTFVNTLARIASTDAKTTGRNADELFKEYLSLNNQTDEAKLARKQALAVANMAVFTQNGGLANCLNHIRSELNRLSRSAIGLDEKGFGLGSLLAPFLTTGANIAEMGIRGALAPATTLATMVNQWRTGKKLDPMKKLALRMDWTYFVFSAVSMVLLAALTSDDDEFYTDPYVTGRKYDPNKPYDSINLGGVWLDLDFFGPFAIPMRTAAKAIQEWKKDNGILAGYGESAKTVLSDIPLAESIINNQVSWATKKPGDWAKSYVYNQANKLIPSIIKPTSRAISRGAEIEFNAQDVIGRVAGRKFHRNYGFDGAELTTQDLIEILTIKAQLSPELNEQLTRSLLQQTD